MEQTIIQELELKKVELEAITKKLSDGEGVISELTNKLSATEKTGLDLLAQIDLIKAELESVKIAKVESDNKVSALENDNNDLKNKLTLTPMGDVVKGSAPVKASIAGEYSSRKDEYANIKDTQERLAFFRLHKNELVK